MKKWPQKLRLLSILTVTKELISRSPEEGYSTESPEQITDKVDILISDLLSSEMSLILDKAIVLFSPTGDIQEISISNGWHDTYMLLAKEFDKLV